MSKTEIFSTNVASRETSSLIGQGEAIFSRINSVSNNGLVTFVAHTPAAHPPEVFHFHNGDLQARDRFQIHGSLNNVNHVKK